MCKFPVKWSGHWFQSGVPHLLTINTSVIETKGICVENEGDKFIIEDRWVAEVIKFGTLFLEPS